MMKQRLCLKLYSAQNTVSLIKQLKFNRIRVKKIRYKTSANYQSVLTLDVAELSAHQYIDPLQKSQYFFALFVEDSANRIINYVNIDHNDWDYNGSPVEWNSFQFNILMDGEFETNINVNNPIMIELEYENI